MLTKKYSLSLVVLFFISFFSLPYANAAGWNVDIEDKATGLHSTQLFTDVSDISGKTFQINSPNGSYMYYTKIPKTADWNFSVDVNAQVLGGFFISAVSHLPMVGHDDGFGCGIAPYDDGNSIAFEESASAIFDRINYYSYSNWTGGWLGMGQYHLNTWYTVMISITGNASHIELSAYNETGHFMGGCSAPYGDDTYPRIVDGFLGFGAGANGGNYTVRNVQITTPSDVTPKIMINTQCSTGYSDFKVSINGNISCRNKGLADAPVLLSYSVNNGSSWNELTAVMSDSQGSFNVQWRPNVSGNYLLKASYSGNELFASCASVVSFNLLPFMAQSVFSVTSNSTTYGFAFNDTSSELSFTVTGPSGTRGFAQVTIAKSMFGGTDGFKVLIDGKPVEYKIDDTADSVVLTFEYSHSTHQVVVSFDAGARSSLQEPNLWILASIVVILSSVLAVIFYKVTKTRGTPAIKAAYLPLWFL